MKRQASVLAGVAGVLIAVLGVACGKKGPPLPPLPQLPAAVEDFKVRRVGSTVYVHFKIPVANQDKTRPADIARIEVYGYTGTPGNTENLLKYGTLVATIAVRRPPDPDQEGEKGKKTEKGKKGEKGGGKPSTGQPPPAKKVAPPEPGFDQGAVVTVTEEITPAILEPVVVPVPKRRPVQTPEPRAARPLWSDDAALSARLYIAVGVNHRGKRGAVSARGVVPLVAVGNPSPAVRVTYTDQAITLAWDPPVNIRRAVQDTVLATNLASSALGTTWCQPAQDPVPGTNLPSRSLGPACWPVQDKDPIQTLAATPKFTVSAPSRYNVYTFTSPHATLAVPPPGGLPAFEMPVPLNEKPLETPTFEQPRGEYGVERCYVVRTVDAFGAMEEDSAASPVACVTPKDIFPPAAPRGLGAVASGGAINLIWEPNTEPDLAGYIVLRGEVPAGGLAPTDLRQITPAPVRETTYRDGAVKVGVRYVYAVIALDKATPPNVSTQSNRVEETAR